MYFNFIIKELKSKPVFIIDIAEIRANGYLIVVFLGTPVYFSYCKPQFSIYLTPFIIVSF